MFQMCKRRGTNSVCPDGLIHVLGVDRKEEIMKVGEELSWAMIQVQVSVCNYTCKCDLYSCI